MGALRVCLRLHTIDKPSRISLINYFGNDNPLSTLRLETEQHEEVSHSTERSTPWTEGLALRIGYLRRRRIERIVSRFGIVRSPNNQQCALPLIASTTALTTLTDPHNDPLFRGPHVEDFGDALERTHFFGTPVPQDQSWQAKSQSRSLARFRY